MIQDIIADFNKKRRPSLNQRSFNVSVLKTLVYNSTLLPKACSDNCIKNYIKSKSNLLYNNQRERVYRVTDQEFKACLLNDAIAQFNKALYNWSIYKQLVSKGLWSWAFITLYYSQFYSVNALLNIQGNAFSRPLIEKPDGKEVQILFHVYTDEFQEGKFIFEMRDHKPHEDIWQEYHYIYNNKFRYKLSEYNELYQFDADNKKRFLELRHEVNYDLSFLFNGFVEYKLQSDELEIFAKKMQQDVFENSPSGDDEEVELEYIASLRIKLLFDILYDILCVNNLIPLRNKLYLDHIDMLNKIKDNTPVKDRFLKWLDEKKIVCAS